MRAVRDTDFNGLDWKYAGGYGDEKVVRLINVSRGV